MPKSARRAALLMALLALQLSTAGCFGKFALVRKVYGFNESVGDKWLRSILCWVLFIIPVYALAGFADFVLLNVIEFWTGNNPAAMNEGQTVEKTAVAADGTRLRMILGDRGARTRLELTRPGGETQVIELGATEGGAVAFDGGGRLLGSTEASAAGGLEVRDRSGRLLAEKSALETAQLAGSLRAGAEALAAALEAQTGRRLATR